MIGPPAMTALAAAGMLLTGLAGPGCTEEQPQPSSAAPAPRGNPFQSLLVTGSPPPVESRGTLDFRVVHAPGGGGHKAWVAILRGGTSDAVWTDEVAATRLPLGEGAYDVRLDRLGGAVTKSGIVVKAGETTRVELSTDTGALRIEAGDTAGATRRAARVWVTREDGEVVWNGRAVETSLVLPAGVYDVECEEGSRTDRVAGVKIEAGKAGLVRCVLR